MEAEGLTVEKAAEWTTRAKELADRHPEDVRDFVYDLALQACFMANNRRSRYKYDTYQDLMLQLGTPKRASLTLPAWCAPMEAQQCYANAYELAAGDPDLTYVEGYAYHSFLPVSHAWVEDRDGYVIDPTWADLDDNMTHAYYLGVRFDTEFLMSRSSETGWISFFANDWERDAEILRLGFVMDGDLAIGIGEL